MSNNYTYYEFFAGGGMARAGLDSAGWECLFSNDFDYKKSQTYKRNWGDNELLTQDIKELKTGDLPQKANLVWASFPCQDLSLAGGGAGLKGDRSGTFWPFWRLMENLISEKRAPKIIVLENVCGALTSHKGKDFKAICTAFQNANYKFGALVIDASLFVPQSRPRLFVIGIHETVSIPEQLISDKLINVWCPTALKTAYSKLPSNLQNNWVWWNLPIPESKAPLLSNIIEDEPTGVDWHSADQTQQLLSMMSSVNLKKVYEAKASKYIKVGTIYKRTRVDENGVKVQRAEIRFDEIAGCLRTPAGGSSRQVIMIVQGGNIKSRLISTRETARLMGLPESYELPEKYNEAYHLTGDGVVVPVVKHLADFIFTPLLESLTREVFKAA